MDDEHFACCGTVRIQPLPMDVILNLDTFMGAGVQSLQITIRGKEYIFSLDDIEEVVKMLAGDIEA